MIEPLSSIPPRRPARRAGTLAPCVILALVLGGCAITPAPLGENEQAARAERDRAALFQDQPPVTGPITLSEAVARALSYNLDYQLTAMERALQVRQLDVSRYDLLPKLATNGGLTARNNDAASSSLSILTGRQSLEPSTSQDRRRATADLTASWNVLDFGVSYYQAQQQADRTLVAAERRRRTVHAIVQQVRGAYWQAVAAQHLKDDIERVLIAARQALADSERAEQQQLLPPLDALRYQKALIEIVQQLEGVSDELAIAKTQLAALMNLPPGTPFEVAVPDLKALKPPTVAFDVAAMERLALVNRPELREEGYQARIDSHEARKALLKMLPGLSLSTGANYDSNSYLQDNAWAEAGLRVTWNLFSLLSGPANIQLAETQQAVGETRRLALSMAVLTQVHVGWRQFQRTSQQFVYANRLEAIEQRILATTANAEASEATAELERIRAEAAAVNAALARDRSYAELQNAVASLYVSMGLDPLPETVDSHDLPALTQAVGRTLKAWERGGVALPAQEETPPAPPALTDAPPPVPVASETAPADAVQPPDAPFAVPASPIGVQIAAYRTSEAAVRGWEKLRQAHPAAAKWTPFLAEPAETGDKSYRLFVTGFASVQEAQPLCKQLRITATRCRIDSHLAARPTASRGQAGV